LLSATANASWFANDDKPEYDTWDAQKLHGWLENNHISVPDGYSKKDLQKLVGANWESHKPWTEDVYNAAKAKYEGLTAATFDTWDESRLRSFLVEQGIVEPSGPREQLVLAAKKQYNAYTAAASSVSARASTALYGDSKYQASKSASSLYSQAYPTAASLSDEAYKSASSAYAQATQFANKKLDDTKDYVYSTWDDNQLRAYLEDKGVIKTKSQATRDELLAKVKEVYVSATDPVYHAWNDSYMKQWLVAHGIIRSDAQKKRDEYVALLKKYYYTPQDKVWSSWSDSQLKAWLVKNNVVKSDAQLKREKAEQLIAKNWYSSQETAWSAWDDSSLKTWLVENGYLRTEAQVKRDELVKLVNDKYTDAYSRTADYLTWPDARLRAYLRSWGVDDTKFVGRPSLLQEVRIRYYQGANRVEDLLSAIRQTIYAGVENAEAKLSELLAALTGAKHDAKVYADDKSTQAKKYAADQAAEKAKSAEAAAKSLKKEAEKTRAEL